MSSPLQNSTPTSTVKSFLGCVKTKNSTLMHKLCHPQATAVLIRHGQPRFQSLNQSIQKLEETAAEMDEATWNEIEHVDGDYAVVCTKFSIHRDGKLLQTGSSSFSCWRDPEKGWIILTMSDIAREQDDQVTA